MPIYHYSDWTDTTIPTSPGRPYPLGAYYDGHGINFALYSEYATKVYLCLFRPSHDEKQKFVEYGRINMKGKFLFIPIFTTNRLLVYGSFSRKNSLFFLEQTH